MPEDVDLAGLAHDLRAPLRTLQGELELLLARDMDEGARQGAEACLRLAQGARALFEDVLALAIGREPTACSVADLAQAVADDLRVEVAVDGDARITADPRAARRVLGNLIANAASHGAPPVTVAIGPTGLVVQDGGPGLPGPYADALAADGAIPRHGTHGIGLHLSRLLAQGEGWRLTVEGPWPAVRWPASPGAK